MELIIAKPWRTGQDATARGVGAALGRGALAARADHRLHPLPWAQPVPLRVHGRTCREEWPPAATARACSGTSPPPPICCSSPCAYLAEGQRAGGTRAKPSSPRPPATWPSARPSSTGRARAPPPPPRQRGSGPSTTKRGGRGCCCLCVSSAGWMAGRAVSPNRFAVWGLPPTRDTKASGSGLTKSGDPLAA